MFTLISLRVHSDLSEVPHALKSEENFREITNSTWSINIVPQPQLGNFLNTRETIDSFIFCPINFISTLFKIKQNSDRNSIKWWQWGRGWNHVLIKVKKNHRECSESWNIGHIRQQGLTFDCHESICPIQKLGKGCGWHNSDYKHLSACFIIFKKEVVSTLKNNK